MSAIKSVKVDGRYRIILPSDARRELGIEVGDRLLVTVQGRVIVLLPQPEDFVAATAGLHHEIWQGIDTTAYLNEEREAWAT
jgi:AbrB family looped-hinge helix DNA binding protein